MPRDLPSETRRPSRSAAETSLEAHGDEMDGGIGGWMDRWRISASRRVARYVRSRQICKYLALGNSEVLVGIFQFLVHGPLSRSDGTGCWDLSCCCVVSIIL